MADMSNIETFPNIYDDGKTYVSYKWDMSDFAEKIDMLLRNERMRIDIAHAAQQVLLSQWTADGRENRPDLGPGSSNSNDLRLMRSSRIKFSVVLSAQYLPLGCHRIAEMAGSKKAFSKDERGEVAPFSRRIAKGSTHLEQSSRGTGHSLSTLCSDQRRYKDFNWKCCSDFRQLVSKVNKGLTSLPSPR
jgi:hypothetical protein